MDDEPELQSDVCALPGCENVIMQTEGRPRRRYCSAAHRAAARQLRSRGAASARPAAPTPPALDPPALDPPALDAPADAAEARTARTTVGADAATDPPASAVPAPVAPGRQRVVFAVPLRRRHERRAGAADQAQRHRLEHRRRIGVVLAAALVTLGASTWAGVTSVRVQQPSALPPAGPPAADAAQWASQAEVTLAAVSEGLDRIAQAEAAWNSQPAARRSGPPPPAVEQLQDVKTQLELQRTALLGQMATWRSVPDVESELGELERQLADLEETLAGLPEPSVGNGEHRGTIGDLTRQREMWISQREAKQAELERLRAEVESAVETPLPAVPDVVTPTVDAVLELLEPSSPHSPIQPDDPPAQPAGPVVTQRGEDNRRPKDEVGISAPPNPVGALGDEPDDTSAPEKKGGPVEDTVGGVTDTASSAGPIRGQRASPSEGRVGPVGPSAGLGAGGLLAATAAPVAAAPMTAAALPARSGPVRARTAEQVPADDAAQADQPMELATAVADSYGYGQLVSSAVESGYGYDAQNGGGTDDGSESPGSYSIASAYLAAYGS